MIRKLKILISHKERELRTCHSNSRDRVRNQLMALKMALRIKQEFQMLRRESRAA